MGLLIQQTPAPVTPRVISPRTGEVVRLTDEIEFHLDRGRYVTVKLEGDGKSSAIAHLAVVFSQAIGDCRLRLEDGSIPLEPSQPLVTVRTAMESDSDIVLVLAPWERDDFIEYLLAEHPQQCASVMRRLGTASEHFASGSPSVWRLILDRLAADETNTDIESIVVDELHARINNPALADAIADRYIFPASQQEVGLFGHRGTGEPHDLHVYFSRAHSSVRRCLLHADIQAGFAMHRFIQRFHRGNLQDDRYLLSGQIPRHQFPLLLQRIKHEPKLVSKLLSLFTENRVRVTANCATLLSLCDVQWQPRGPKLQLYGASFPAVSWPDIDLTAADLRNVCLADADLSGAKLVDAKLANADFSRSKLTGASLRPTSDPVVVEESDTDQPSWNSMLDRLLQRRKKQAAETDLRPVAFRTRFDRADLSNANLSKHCFRFATFRSANLQHTNAKQADFDHADFTDADLTHANFFAASFTDTHLFGATIDHADFSRLCCSLGMNCEDMQAEGVDFSNAKMVGSIWTESNLARCNFSGAYLRGARMALIDWEYCDLRNADLRGCTFHMGSTRCGLVASPYPSHGTRTGFYTDDYDDQYFKTPEMIRKASLYGADLRGARIRGVDFYLIDLRQAKFDASQKQQLVATGAILDEPR